MLFITVRDRLIKALLLVASLLFLWSAIGIFFYGQTKPQPEKINVSCIATNYPSVVVNAQTKTPEEIDDWRVDCTIKRGDKLVYGPKPLVLSYPASFHEAMEAIDEFRTKKAAEILKQLKTDK